jgi:hypothetical protein
MQRFSLKPPQQPKNEITVTIPPITTINIEAEPNDASPSKQIPLFL